MQIYALSDPHLGPVVGKQHYSSRWEDHQSQLRKNWDARVQDGDLVLMPGDFSWHRDPDDLKYDYFWIDDRPGQKILSPGNHDYGIWSSLEEAEKFLSRFDTLKPLMNNAQRIENPFGADRPGVVICAVQGTQSPGDKYFNTNAGFSAKGKDPESVRFLGELVALDQALKQAQGLRREKDALVVLIHYPPFANGDEETIFSKMIERAGATLCLYGHLHQKEQWRKTFQGMRNGCEYRFVGADFLRFTPTKIGRLTEHGLELEELEVDAQAAWPEERKSSGWSNSTSKAQPRPKKVHDKQIIRDGSPLFCAECEAPILKDEPHHNSRRGWIHGWGKYDKVGTCRKVDHCDVCDHPIRKHQPAVRKKGRVMHAECAASVAKKSKGKDKGKGSQPKGLVAASATTRTCIVCNQVIQAHEPCHDTYAGWVHGRGDFNETDTCRQVK